MEVYVKRTRMKTIVVAIATLFTTFYYTPSPMLSEVRSLYQQAPKEKQACVRLLDLLKDADEKTKPVLAGYKACATMIMAKHAFNPISKLNYFNKGKNLLERSIKQDQNNIELRFLRFAVQKNAPSFLGYKDDLAADKQFLEREVATVNDQQLKTWIFKELAKQ